MAKDMTRQIRSARSRGAVGPKAIVPRMLLGGFQTGKVKLYNPILDYGCGIDMAHVKWLNQQKIDGARGNICVHGYDIAFQQAGWVKNHLDDVAAGVVEYHPEYDRWGIVYASNVFNVQNDIDESCIRIAKDLANLVYEDGTVYCNLPETPRYCRITNGMLVCVMSIYFEHVQQIEDRALVGNNFVLKCTCPRKDVARHNAMPL